MSRCTISRGARTWVVVPALTLLLGCWPARRTELPDLFFRVEDGTGQPVSARVVILSASEPHSRIWKRIEAQTNREGLFRVERASAWRLEGLGAHGSPSYYMAWCIDGPGLQRRLGAIRNMPESAQVYAVMNASSNASMRCSDDSVLLATEAMSGLK